MTMVMAVTRPDDGRPDEGTDASASTPLTSLVLRTLYRRALVWAGAAAVADVVALTVWRGTAGLLGALLGAGVAVAFLASGRSVHLLARIESFVPAMALFLVQVTALGIVADLLRADHGLDRTSVGLGVVVPALAWTVGVVVTARREHSPIYERGVR